MQINEHQRDFADNGIFFLLMLAGYIRYYFLLSFYPGAYARIESNVNFILDIMK